MTTTPEPNRRRSTQKRKPPAKKAAVGRLNLQNLPERGTTVQQTIRRGEKLPPSPPRDELESTAKVQYDIPKGAKLTPAESRDADLHVKKFAGRAAELQVDGKEELDAERQARLEMPEKYRQFVRPVDNFSYNSRRVKRAKDEEQAQNREDLRRETEHEAQLRGVLVEDLPKIGRTQDKIAKTQAAIRKGRRMDDEAADKLVAAAEAALADLDLQLPDAERAKVRKKAKRLTEKGPRATKNIREEIADSVGNVTAFSDRVGGAPRQVGIQAGTAANVASDVSNQINLADFAAASTLSAVTKASVLAKMIKKYRDNPDDPEMREALITSILDLSSQLLKIATGMLDKLAGSSGVISVVSEVVSVAPIMGLAPTAIDTALAVRKLAQTAQLWVKTSKVSSRTEDEVLKLALLTMKQAHQEDLTKQAISLAASGTKAGSQIADLASGGLAAPVTTPLRFGITIAEFAKTQTYDRALRDLRSVKTKRIREKAIEQGSNDARNQLARDVAHAVDTLVVMAKNPPSDQNDPTVLQGYEDVVDVLESYNITVKDLGRPLSELEASMLAKLKVDAAMPTTWDDLRWAANKITAVTRIPGAVVDSIERDARIRQQGEVKGMLKYDRKTRGEGWVAGQRLRTDEQLDVSERTILERMQRRVPAEQRAGYQRRLLTKKQRAILDTPKREPAGDVAPSDSREVSHPRFAEDMLKMTAAELSETFAKPPSDWNQADRDLASEIFETKNTRWEPTMPSLR